MTSCCAPYSLIGLVGCTWLAGCQEKPEGAQTIIIELADPTDMQENNTAVEGEIEAEESASEADAETMTDAQEMLTVALPEITGFSDGVELSYTQISSSDPIISLLLANVLPDVKVNLLHPSVFSVFITLNSNPIWITFFAF